MKRNKKRYS